MSNAVAHADHGHAHAHHAHHPALQHHFDTMSQQKEAAVIGMWVFLLTEILFFGGLFVAYMIYRVWYFDAFAEAIPIGTPASAPDVRAMLLEITR